MKRILQKIKKKQMMIKKQKKKTEKKMKAWVRRRAEMADGDITQH